MPTIPHIKKKIGQKHLVWFQNSNAFIQFEEPAWFVFQKTTKRYKTKTIAETVAFRYGIPAKESLTFAHEIQSKINSLNKPEPPPNKTKQYVADLNTKTFASYTTHHYRLGTKTITFTYENQYFEQFIHPLLCHLETDQPSPEILPTETTPLFELFSYEHQIIFRFNGTIKGFWTKDESHLTKGLIFIYLINVMYNKTEEDWLMTIHASALTNGSKTILFSAPPGNGKTTIAALLQTQGYQIISDDFVPIDKNTFQAYPFPIAMSIKGGSMDLLSVHYPVLEQKPSTFISPEKIVRYLPSNHQPNHTTDIHPVHEIIFISYNPAVDFQWEKYDLIKGFQLLLDQSWISPHPASIELLFERITQLDFYQLTYSNNQKALEAITNLFKNDE